jgi:cytochrome c-type biogenesis protein CcmH/NrfG
MSQGLQAHAAGNPTAAENFFRQALKLDSKNIDAYYNLGALAEERGDYTEALQDYQNGMHIDPSDQDLKTAYAAATQRLQQINYSKQLAATQAQEQAKTAQQTDQLKLLGANAASAYHAGKYDEAIKDLQSIAAQRPNDPDVQYALAQAYRQKKDYKQAADHINRAITIVPSNPQYQQLLSTILAEKNGKASSIAQGQGIPPAAPGYNRGDSGDLYSGSSNGSNPNNYSQAAASNGGIVPFTPDATESPSGYNSGAWGQGGNSNGGYYNSGYSSSRVKRMLTGALIGATAGGLVGSMFRPSYGYGYGGYGRSSGMMSGALWGGMAGLIFGGIR